MTIGVAAVLAMIAIGTGAEAAIGDQIRAAGMNLIVVTAGNYKVKSTDDFGGGAVEPSAALGLPDPLWRRALSLVEPTLVAHPEDDPMEKHDHPTARQRLGDSEAGLGSAATLTSADADAIRRIRGVQYVAEGLHQNVHVAADAKRWFTRLHGTDLQLPLIRRAWTFPNGRFFSAREQSRAEQVVVLGAVAAERLFGGGNAAGRSVSIWKQPFRVVGVVTTASWMVAPAPGDDQFDAVYIPFTTVHRLLNLTKLNDITITAASTGEVSRIMNDVTMLVRARHRITDETPDDFTVTTQARQALAKGGLRPDVARAVVASGLSRYLHWSTTISPGAVVVSVSVAAAVGIFFGWYPARQAARLDPIQSLRYE